MSKSRFRRNSFVALGAAICLTPGVSLAVQTYTDSLADYAGGSASAPPASDSFEDIASVVITNNSSVIFFQINLNPSVSNSTGSSTTDILTSAQSYGKYQVGLETVPGAGSKAVSNPYNPIGISSGMNYWIDSWTDQGGGGTDANPDTGDNQVFGYSSGGWSQTAGNGLAGDVPSNPSQFTQTQLSQTAITLSIPLASLGLSVGNQFNFDVWSTFGSGEGAVDALDSGAAATSESSSTYINPYTPTPYDAATAPGSTYSTTIYQVATPTFTWNDSTAAAGYFDGTTWDVNDNTKYNWNNGIFADYYTDNSNVIFNDINNGNYVVTLNTTVSPASVTVSNSAGNYTISGTGKIAGTGSLTKSGTGTLILATVNTYSGGTTVSAGKLIIEPTSSTTSALPSGSLAISGGAVQIAKNVTAGSQTGATPASNVNISSLSITGNGALDITNNHIIIDYVSGHDPISSIAALIQGGYANGTWTGNGIMSTMAQSNASYGIGYADSADVGNPAGLSSGQIEIKYTLLGDANLDGKVNGSDFTLMAANFNDSVSAGWDKGDFNYSGTVNGDDFVLLADNFNDFASQSAVSAADLAALDSFAAANGISLTSVPEPASVGICAIVMIGLLQTRLRRKTRQTSASRANCASLA
jgi:autotransporter-associated beta strand protein